MRVIFLLYMLLSAFLTVSLGQSEENPSTNAIRVVSNALADRGGSQMIINSFTQKQLWRLGDSAAAALTKILDHAEIDRDDKVRLYLPIIRAAFDRPRFIERSADKNPTVTLGLLSHLQGVLTDPATQKGVLETMELVKQKTLNREGE